MRSSFAETLAFDDASLASQLFGPLNAHLDLIADASGATLHTRGTELTVSDPRPEQREPDDAEKKREANLRAWRQKESKRRQVTPHAVLPSRALMWLKAHGADDLGAVPQLGEKRARLYGDALRRLCRQGK